MADVDLNDEHIFPLTLGGHDRFTIKVSKFANVRANKEIDEKLKACPFLATNRKRHGTTGHRSKTVNPPKAKITSRSDKSIVFKFDNNDLLQLYSHKRLKFLTAENIKAEGLTLSLRHEKNLRLKFSAKVALASGYYVYKHIFVKNAKVEDLRALMNYLGKCHDETAFDNITSTGWYWPKLVDASDADMQSIFQSINDTFDCSFVALITSAVPDKIIFVVGVLGHLTGVISCPANCDKFPKYGDYDLGHVIILRGNKVERLSFRECLQAAANFSNS
ncbi:hypothetical protein [Nitrosomonas sp. Nm33]|uniref:hypothetical protein n=1 Tax=Nitrosomonas sp. Nm33 TaxID=133724 RepID=UPI000B857514|nr:hypothetical protein [Nitrosomonas sp. Nm33]